MSEQSVKPSRSVRVGDVVSVFAGGVHRTVKVVALLDRRVGAKLVPQYLGDMTPPEEFARARQERQKRSSPFPGFPRGFGRPTKKQRRHLSRIADRQ
jgi:ribosome-associated heat shock protein Hsp15